MNVTLNIENKILDIIASLSGKHHSNEIFFDWVESFAIAINNCNCECDALGSFRYNYNAENIYPYYKRNGK